MSVINQMLRDLEARGANQQPAGPKGTAPRRRRAAGRRVLLGLLLLGTAGAGVWQYGPWPGSTGAPRAEAGSKPEPERTAPTASDKPARSQTEPSGPSPNETTPGERERRVETGEGEAPVKATAAPRSAPNKAVGKKATAAAPSTSPREAEPDNDKPEATGGPAKTPQRGSEAPAVAGGYALQLGTFSQKGHPEAFLAELPGAVREEAYLYTTAEGFRTVRYGFAVRRARLQPSLDRLRGLGLRPVVVASRRRAGSAPAEAKGGDSAAPEPKAEDRPSTASAAADVSRAAARKAPSRMKKEPRRPSPAEQTERRLEAARRLYRSGQPAAAEERLRRALALTPGRPEVRSLLARTLLQQGRAVEAKGVLAENLEAHPERAIDRELLARVRMGEGDLEAAVGLLEEGLAQGNRNDPDYQALLAALYQRTGAFGQSVEAYRTALAARPEKGVWWMGLGIALEGSGKAGEAAQAYRRAFGRVGKPDLKAFIRGRLAKLGNPKK